MLIMIFTTLALAGLDNTMASATLQTEMSFPEGTPKVLKQKVSIENKECIAVEISATYLPQKKCTLYFPADGQQPTLRQAAEWSGARAEIEGNGNVSEAIINWYVAAFGGSALGCKHPVELGFRNWERHISQISCPIIQFNTLNFGADQQKEFWHSFRKVAQNPIGCILLYKLLIEIRRKHRKVRALANSTMNPERNLARSLIVELADDDCGWHYYAATKAGPSDPGVPAFLSCNFSTPLKPALVKMNIIPAEKDIRPVRKRRNSDSSLQCLLRTQASGTRFRNGSIFSTEMPDKAESYHVALFHELLHWYYQLSTPGLYAQELDVNVEDAVESRLWKSYFGEPTACPLLSWGPNFTVDLNDLRVICGDPDDENCLSENAFRYFAKLPMRFGHGQKVTLPTLLHQDAIKTAHNSAVRTIKTVIKGEPINWVLAPGQALLK